nr:wiskott-Aldrich syndrome protein homolog 1-like [Aegilops tauschii subsp. strangulata]
MVKPLAMHSAYTLAVHQPHNPYVCPPLLCAHSPASRPCCLGRVPPALPAATRGCSPSTSRDRVLPPRRANPASPLDSRTTAFTSARCCCASSSAPRGASSSTPAASSPRLQRPAGSGRPRVRLRPASRAHVFLRQAGLGRVRPRAPRLSSAHAGGCAPVRTGSAPPRPPARCRLLLVPGCRLPAAGFLQLRHRPALGLRTRWLGGPPRAAPAACFATTPGRLGTRAAPGRLPAGRSSGPPRQPAGSPLPPLRAGSAGSAGSALPRWPGRRCRLPRAGSA